MLHGNLILRKIKISVNLILIKPARNIEIPEISSSVHYVDLKVSLGD